MIFHLSLFKIFNAKFLIDKQFSLDRLIFYQSIFFLNQLIK